MLKDFFQFIHAWKIWHVLFHDFIWLDWLLLLTCLAAVIWGIFKGFGLYFGMLVRILILIFTVMLLYPPLFEWASSKLTFAKPGFWQPFFFLVIGVGMFFILSKLAKFQSKKKGIIQFHPFWDRILGALAGFFYVLLVSSLLANFFLLLPSKKIAAVFSQDGSRHGAMMRDFVPQLVDTSLAPVRMLVNRKVMHP